MKRRISLSTAVAAAAMACFATYANAGTDHGEWRTLQSGNKLTVPMYRAEPERPYALTGDLARTGDDEIGRCVRELRQGGNKLTTLGFTCTSR